MQKLITKLWLKMKENLIPIIITASIALVISITLICYYNIPRLTYRYSDQYDGYLVDKAYGNKESITIPKSYNNKPVVGIGQRAFLNKGVKRVEFESKSNIKIIEKLAFSECKNLESIDLSNVILIERNAFSYCTSLSEVRVGAISIGASAFYKCESLESVTILEGLESIGSMALAETKISDIILPESLEFIYNDCFSYNDSLRRVVIKNPRLLNNDYIKSIMDLIVVDEG